MIEIKILFKSSSFVYVRDTHIVYLMPLSAPCNDFDFPLLCSAIIFNSYKNAQGNMENFKSRVR